MRITPVSRGALCVVSILIFLGSPAPSSAQDLLVARAESLNKVFDGMEAISNAAGQPFSREMVLGMGSEIFGSDPSGFLALDRPVAALMPMEGMMMQHGDYYEVGYGNASYAKPATLLVTLRNLVGEEVFEGLVNGDELRSLGADVGAEQPLVRPIEIPQTDRPHRDSARLDPLEGDQVTLSQLILNLQLVTDFEGGSVSIIHA